MFEHKFPPRCMCIYLLIYCFPIGCLIITDNYYTYIQRKRPPFLLSSCKLYYFMPYLFSFHAYTYLQNCRTKTSSACYTRPTILQNRRYLRNKLAKFSAFFEIWYFKTKVPWNKIGREDNIFDTSQIINSDRFTTGNGGCEILTFLLLYIWPCIISNAGV